ncbi:M20 family metallopeptidase [Streptomyces sp. NPDC048172]|uniref:M20 metallopeptidase family protein n=1 Tax=Streptomyces sp. NPDC048172 TaxID=3365505 RepID=UPI003710A694
MKRSEKHAPTRRAVLVGTGAAGAALALGAGGAAAAAPASGGRGWQAAVDAETARLEPELLALRRDLHRHPETAGQERYTARAVARQLRAAGLAVTTGVGGHGVVGVLRGALPGRTVAYRADMDAVPPGGVVGGGTEPAHVCGHDIHTTVGVGIARVLARLRRRLCGTVVFLFQPAEEALTGAAAMLDEGVLARTGAAEVHALHCGPFPVGQFAVTPGYGLPGQDRAEIALSGPDAPAAAKRLAAEIGGLATVRPPETAEAMEQLVADVQTPGGPLARFVVAFPKVEESVVRVSSRCWPQERYTEVRREIRRLAATHAGARVRFPSEPSPAMVCPEDDGLALSRHLRGALGRSAVTRLHAAFPFNGEDFALFLQRVPGTYTFLGVRPPGTSVLDSMPHYPGFTPDEGAIAHGVRGMTGWLAERARGGRNSMP